MNEHNDTGFRMGWFDRNASYDRSKSTKDHFKRLWTIARNYDVATALQYDAYATFRNNPILAKLMSTKLSH